MCDRYILIQPIKGQLISVDIAFWVHEELIILIQIEEIRIYYVDHNTFFYTSSLLSQPLAPYQEAECVGLQIFLNSFGYFNKCLLLCDSIENPLENPVVCNILRTELPPWFGVIRIFRWEVGPRAFYFGSTILLYFHRVTVTIKGFDTFDFLKY